MARLKIDNGLYFHVRSMLNAILPLEYTIRAFRSEFSQQFLELKSINDEIYQFWIRQGFSDEQIKHELLMDYAWDSIQFRWPMVRNHGRVFLSSEVPEKIRVSLIKIEKEFSHKVINGNYPFVDRFRIVDLMNGNDIGYLLSKIISIRKAMVGYAKKDDIPMREFAFKIRYPILFYPNSFYMTGKSNKGDFIGICLDMRMSYDDVKGSINEFIYQYAKMRDQYNNNDTSASKLINDFLSDNMFNAPKEDSEVIRIDSLLTGVSGLLCFDEAEKIKIGGSRSYRKDAVNVVINYYPELEREQRIALIEKNYKDIQKKIKFITNNARIRQNYKQLEFSDSPIVYHNVME